MAQIPLSETSRADRSGHALRFLDSLLVAGNRFQRNTSSAEWALLGRNQA
jgi:hypothetical protein